MITRINASVVMALSAALLAPASAFSPNSMKVRPSLATRLNVHAAADSEDDAMYLMMKAQECANSDTCSIDSAREYLREVIHVQSGCAAGTLAGYDLCEDQLFAAEVVASLREKIKEGSEVKARNFWQARQQEFEDLTVASLSSDGSGFSATGALNAPIKPVYLGLAAVCVTMFVNVFSHNTGGDVVPFTLEEWKWAFQGGYLGDMVSHSLKHGGLLVGENTVEGVMTPFTPQEWWWAAKDGYLGDMVGHYARHGGLLVSENGGDVATPFTPQEWMWAIQGGYVGDMVSHFARNGGLLVSDNSLDAVTPFTAQEWWWAARGGYLDDMVNHYMRNGGL
mmetsp:Transcript_45338/g.68382  ORF Transcript_45338/g.68382 Transcript_45338/m.68382 type:complete len:337 (-) Transcript_45338:151-1161(-)